MQRRKKKRSFTKTDRLTGVDFVIQDKAYWGFIGSIHEDGVFIETPETFSNGQQITLAYPCPTSKEHIKMTGEIAGTDLMGIEVKFSSREETMGTST